MRLIQWCWLEIILYNEHFVRIEVHQRGKAKEARPLSTYAWSTGLL